jgi:hypothetical protein
MATKDYVPVTGDDWYQRRRDDAEGKFFRKVADQGPRKGEGGSTRQGIYMLTADGKLLAYKNAGQNPDVMRDVLRQGLREWKKLPEERRKPAAIKVEELTETDKHYTRTPPTGGLIVNVYTRILDHDAKAGYRKGTSKAKWGDLAARDHLWITEKEWKSLIPAEPKKGEQAPLPEALARRIFCFHMIDNTRGEPPMWGPQQIRSHKLTVIVEEVTAGQVRLRLDGSALLSTDADTKKADRGFDLHLLGYIEFDRNKKAITSFDVVAVGDHWGEGTYTRGARPGRTPLGVAFELSKGDSAADLVPPQGAREISRYLGQAR